MEPNKKLGWYYVGNGQLRYMDANGWTEQYRNIDDPVPAEETQQGPTLLAGATPTTPVSRRSKPWLITTTAAAVTALAVSAAWATGILIHDPAEIQSSVAPTLASAATQTAASPTPAGTFASTPAPAEPETSTAPAPTRAPRPVASSRQAPAAPPPVESDFDEEWALAKAGDIVEDIGTVDERLSDGIQVDGALNLLSDSYGRLADAGVPPGLDAASYLARVTTLQSFSAQAADGYDVDPTDATAKYLVVREETGVLFKQINGAIGSDLALP